MFNIENGKDKEDGGNDADRHKDERIWGVGRDKEGGGSKEKRS